MLLSFRLQRQPPVILNLKIHPAQTLLIADGPYRDALDVVEFKTVGVSTVNELDEAKCVC